MNVSGPGARSLGHWALCLVACIALCSGGTAALTWERDAIELAAQLADREAQFSYQFRNTGEVPIRILAVEPSCSCTTTELYQWSYAPGESGEVKVAFDFGDRTGRQEKTIRVTTDDKQAPVSTLRFRVSIPVLLQFAPNNLEWRRDEEFEEKSILIVVADETRTASPTLAGPVPGGFEARIEPVEVGRRYRVVVRPVAPPAVAGAVIPIPCIARLDDGSIYPFRVRVVMR